MCAWCVWRMCVCVGKDVCRYVCACMLSPFSCVQLCMTLWTRVYMLSHFSRIWLLLTLWTIAYQARLVCGILQARILKWVSMPSSKELPNWGIEPVCLTSPVLAGRFFNTGATMCVYITLFCLWERPYFVWSTIWQFSFNICTFLFSQM